MSQTLIRALQQLPRYAKRTDIISSHLCDDVLERLKPSLVPYIGCSIIDLNPGVGLFSSKIHESVRPRSHVLLEPRQDRYQAFLQPLLDAPDSRYHLRDWPDEHRWTIANYVREGLIPDASGHGGPPPTTAVANNLVLMIANLDGWSIGSPSVFKSSNFTGMKAMEFASNARRSHLTGSPPPPRTLMWIDNKLTSKIHPRTVDYRLKRSSILEEYCHVEEIVGSAIRMKGAVRREDSLDAKSKAIVAKRMQDSEINIAALQHRFASDNGLDLSSTSRDWHEELEQLESGFNAGTMSQFIDIPPGPLVKKLERGDKRTYSPAWLRLVTLKRTLVGQNTEIEKVGRLLDMQAKIDRTDLECYEEDISEALRIERRQLLEEETRKLKEAQARLTKKEFYRFMFLDDDRRAFRMDPPLLMWDRRQAEPLRAHKDEFCYPKDLALLDFQTLPSPTSVKMNMTADQEIYYDLIASSLLSMKGPTTLKHLDSIGPGAYSALVKSVPTLLDARKGGRRDIDSVRARTLTSGMLQELAVAWDNWAFKPPLAHVLQYTEYTDVDKLLRAQGPAARMF